jgi:hypothetical protein
MTQTGKAYGLGKVFQMAVVEEDDFQQQGEVKLDFRFDLRGRVRNLSLPASAANALIPLFESLSNSLHAIETRFGEEAANAGRIEIDILRTDQNDASAVAGFIVRDNGIGLKLRSSAAIMTSASSVGAF